MTGPIGSGKTTVAESLAARFGAVHLSSDALRGPRGHPFGRMTQALESALAHGHLVVLDSTGMSYRFRALVMRVRDRALHAHLHVDSHAWREREQIRRDRPMLDASVYRRSLKPVFVVAPDLVIDTTALAPPDVAAIVANAWEQS